MSYINFEVPAELKKKVTTFISNIVKADVKNIRKGVNEATKNVERQKAKLVVIAGDVDASVPYFILAVGVVHDGRRHCVPVVWVCRAS